MALAVLVQLLLGPLSVCCSLLLASIQLTPCKEEIVEHHPEVEFTWSCFSSRCMSSHRLFTRLLLSLYCLQTGARAAAAVLAEAGVISFRSTPTLSCCIISSSSIIADVQQRLVSV